MFRQSPLLSEGLPGLLSHWVSIRGKNLRLRHLIAFATKIYQSGKFIELSSYVYWEVLYKLGLMKCIEFTDADPLGITTLLNDPTQTIDKTWSIMPCPENSSWKMISSFAGHQTFGVDFNAPNILTFLPSDAPRQDMPICPDEIAAIYPLGDDTALVSLFSGGIYLANGPAKTLDHVLDLETDSSYLRYNAGVTQIGEDTLLLGEYGNVSENKHWRAIANLYLSVDRGKTWSKSDFLVRQGVNKHVHLVHYFEAQNKLVVTDGDNKKQVWRGEITGSSLKDFAQIDWSRCSAQHRKTGGYTSVVEDAGTLFFGTDYLGGTNFIVTTTDMKTLTRRAIPNPYRHAPVLELFTRTAPTGTEIWASLHNWSDPKTQSLLMVSTDHGQTWRRVFAYDGTQHRLHIASTNQSPIGELVICVTQRNADDTEMPVQSFILQDVPTNQQ